MLKNILYITASIIVFFAGLILYGIILNMREPTLAEALSEKGISKIVNPKLIVDRRNYKVELYLDKKFVKSYKAVFGKNNSSTKRSADDFVTPIGEYRICRIDTLSKYHKFLQLDYPNEKDAAEALKQGYISIDEYNAILNAREKFECPPPVTRLGANIGIHGIGEYDIIFRNLPFVFNWTNGSISVSNRSIDELYSVVKIGTPVKIKL